MKTLGIVAMLLGLVLLQVELFANVPWMPVAAGLLLVTGMVIWIVQFNKMRRALQQTHWTVREQVSRFLFNDGKSGVVESLNSLETELKNATEFIKHIGEGKFDVPYPGMTPALQTLNQNNLSGELLHMKRKMQGIAEEERQRLWAASGLTRFSEMARQQNENTTAMLNQFIGELVKYIGANQGAIFVVNHDEPDNLVLELKGCYAYGRRKFEERSIAPGDGLVGQAFLEGDIIYLTAVPQNYVNITSGLGEATPTCVILVPLKSFGTVEGILELASFDVLKKFETDFLQQVGEILGSALRAMNVTETTRKLLHASQQQATQLQAQEEELKQNMEELQATQEEIQRQMLATRKLNQELDARVAALNTSTIMSESNLYGDIVYVNDKFCEVSQYSREELIGAPHKKVRHPDMPGAVFKAMWTTIKAGNVFRGIVKNRKKDGSHYWVDAVISPVLSENGKPIKYIGVRYVIEDDEMGSRLFEKQLLALGVREEVEIP